MKMKMKMKMKMMKRTTYDSTRHELQPQLKMRKPQRQPLIFVRTVLRPVMKKRELLRLLSPGEWP